MSEHELTQALEKATDEIQSLKMRLNALEQATGGKTALPETKLLSESFLTRAFAVLGHYMVAALIVALPFYIIIFIIIALVGNQF
jgi:hypothetical protein